MVTERAPYGVIASITPCTNPTETIINNGIGMVAGGNAVVGVDIDYEVVGKAGSMLMVSVSGTAVVVE
mgnify:CR=1 FL=1